MKSLPSVLIAIPMASVMLFAQQTTTTPATTPATSSPAESSAQTYKGTIVNATCTQASALTTSRSGMYADRAGSAGNDQSASTKTTTNNNQKSVYDLQQDVMRHCPANAKVTSFALLTDDGRFFKLDDAGNTQVKAADAKSLKNMKASVTGTIEGDTLKVQSLNKM